MWIKDQNGNWYMANQSIIEETFTSFNVWTKDESGQWLLAKSQDAVSSPQTSAVYHLAESL
jgi:ketosteroid isomerase-like protein